MNLAIDSGNSFTKIGFFEKGKLLNRISVNNKVFSEQSIPYLAEKIIISSVSSIDFSFLKKENVLELNAKTPVPVKINYQTPAGPGADRVAAICGAFALFPEEDVVVINAGTCITIDFLSKAGEFAGGTISPGINLRYKALNSFTARLPLIETQDFAPLTGTSTEEAMAGGVLNGVVFEVAGFINAYKKKYPTSKIILTGGDSIFFERKLKDFIFVVPDLVLTGLNYILETKRDSN